jgi:hypothetical protein
MASTIYNATVRDLLNASLDLVNDDIRAMLVMTNTTVDTEGDAEVLDDFTTVDECDATGYARVALTGEAVTYDIANSRAEFDANDVVFSGLGGDSTRDYQGVLLYKHVDGTVGNDIAVAFIEFTNQPLTSASTQVSIPWNAEGILQMS